DPAIDATAREEAWALIVPALGDRIAEEDHVHRLVRGEQLRIIVRVIAGHSEVAPKPVVKPLVPVDARWRPLRREQWKRKRGLEEAAAGQSHQMRSSNAQISGRSGPSCATPESLNRTCAGAAGVKRGHWARPG